MCAELMRTKRNIIMEEVLLAPMLLGPLTHRQNASPFDTILVPELCCFCLK